MMLLHRLASVLRWMVRRKRAEPELDDELRTFVDMAADDRINEGSTPHEARRLAVLQLGGVELFGESGPAGADRWGRNRRPCRCGGIAPVWVGGRVRTGDQPACARIRTCSCADCSRGTATAPGGVRDSRRSPGSPMPFTAGE